MNLTDGLNALRLLRVILRNSLDAWPPQVFTDRVVRSRFLGQTTVWLSDPDLVGELLVDQADAFEKAPSMRRALVPALGDAILTADGARWRWQRRAAAPAFRPDQVQALLPTMFAAARDARARWAALPEGAVLDVGHEMMRVTFDVVLDAMLSGRGGFDIPRVEQGIRDYLDSTGWAVAYSALNLPSWTPYPGQLTASRGQAYLRDTLRRRVRARRAAADRGRDLLSLLLDAVDPETGQAMDDRDVTDNILTFVGAGHETTALTLAWTFFLLARHPQAERLVLEEIATVTGGAEVEAAHLPALGYTRQVIFEALRLYPPAPILVRQAIRDVRLGDEAVARGDGVFAPTYAIHRHALLWDEPDRFDPERFSPDAIKSRHRYAYLPFGAGPRICIGMGFALQEAVAILATLLPAARLAAISDRDPVPKLRVTLRAEGGIAMRLTRRPDRSG